MPRTPRQTTPKQAADDAAVGVGGKRGNYRQYTDADKATALVALEANDGNVRSTARALNIPWQTLNQWSRDIHINADVPKISDEKRIDFTEMLEAEINAALGAMNGKRDDGSYSDMARTVGIFIDKLELLRGNATSRHEISGTVSITDFLRGDDTE